MLLRSLVVTGSGQRPATAKAGIVNCRIRTLQVPLLSLLSLVSGQQPEGMTKPEERANKCKKRSCDKKKFGDKTKRPSSRLGVSHFIPAQKWAKKEKKKEKYCFPNNWKEKCLWECPQNSKVSGDKGAHDAEECLPVRSAMHLFTLLLVHVAAVLVCWRRR